MMNVFTAFVLIIALGQEVGAVCPAAYIDLGTGCYRFGIQEVTSWEQAYFTCKLELNGYLVEIESQQEQDNIKAYIKGVVDPAGEKAFWIGSTDLLKEGEFRWMTSGNLITFSAWRAGEPNNLNGDESCLVIEPDNDYLWFDLECGDEIDWLSEFSQKAICETDPIE